MADKSETIAKYGRHGTDVGSAQAQTALLTMRIGELAEHFARHPRDVHSRRGLIGMVNRRRRLLAYLGRKDPAGYRDLIARLGLRK